MKTNFASGLIKTIGLTAGLASALAIGWMPNSVHAEQPNRLLQLPTRHTSPQQFPEFAGIDLTQEQKEQIKDIRRELQPELEAILPRPELTPEQQEQINSDQPVRISLPAPTPEQQAKLKELMQEYRQKVEAVLTPEQQEQFRQNQNTDMIFLEL